MPAGSQSLLLQSHQINKLYKIITKCCDGKANPHFDKDFKKSMNKLNETLKNPSKAFKNYSKLYQIVGGISAVIIAVLVIFLIGFASRTCGDNCSDCWDQQRSLF